jgi:DNA-binding response OmpR family regulator
MKILCVDDSIVSRHLLDSTLRKWGYEVIAACDGSEAWEILNRDPEINLAILDWVMPTMTGIELCRKVRADLGRYVYILFLTSKGLREDLIEGFEAGADDFMTKPFDQYELKVRLRAGTRIVDMLGYSVGPLQPIQFYSCFIRACSHYSQCFDDECKAEKRQEDDVQFFKT